MHFFIDFSFPAQHATCPLCPLGFSFRTLFMHLPSFSLPSAYRDGCDAAPFIATPFLCLSILDAGFMLPSCLNGWYQSGGRVEEKAKILLDSRTQLTYCCHYQPFSLIKIKFMATVANNSLMKGLRGTFGNQLVFRQMNGKTLVAPKGRTPDRKKETPAQRNTRSTFKQATQWAHHVLQDPKQKEYYQQRAKALKLPNAYTAAITDYMRKAKVEKVETDNQVTVTVCKPGFALKQVEVKSADETAPQPTIKMKRDKVGWKFIVIKPIDEKGVLLMIRITNAWGRISSMELVI